jgi:hypothetical protein
MQAAFAGRNCEALQPTPLAVSESLQLAQMSYDALDQSGASVAIIARAGQNLSKYGLSYSHLALVWRDHPDGRWTVVHELNQCGTDHADLFNQGLGDFFMDDMYQYRTLIMIPSPALQVRITDALAHGRAKEAYTPHYNMLAYPFSTQFQNSNQWALEFLAEAMAQDLQIHDRQAAQNWLQAAGYRPTTLQIGAFERLGADLTRNNISFDDHPFERRMAGQIDTVTVDSIEQFLKLRDPGMREMTLQVQR